MPGDEAQRARVTEGIRLALEPRGEILFACLHGSFQAGGPYRDVDIAVWLDSSRIPRESWSRYALDLSVGLHLALKVPVDVRVLNEAPLTFRYHALKGEPLVVRDRELLDEMRARTWDEYFDFLPFARRYLREALGE
jgi:predicted nucleotidyltransferase